MARAETALPILVLFLGQLDILWPPLGQTVLCYASRDGAAVWSVLALIQLDWDGLGRQVGYGTLFFGLSLCCAGWFPASPHRIAGLRRWSG